MAQGAEGVASVSPAASTPLEGARLVGQGTMRFLGFEVYRARLWAQRGDHLFLAARNDAAMRSVADDLKARGALAIGQKVFDAAQFDQHAALIREATEFMGGLDTVLIAHGTLSDQARAWVREHCEVGAKA